MGICSKHKITTNDLAFLRYELVADAFAYIIYAYTRLFCKAPHLLVYIRYADIRARRRVIYNHIELLLAERRCVTEFSKAIYYNRARSVLPKAEVDLLTCHS